MTDTSPPPPGSNVSSRRARHDTPTWEIELLISGVAVFAMLQLSGWLDDRLFALLPRFDDSWGQPLLMLYIYLKCTALILGVTFAMHLLLRAQWIATVGMHSIYPGGIRWEKLKMGPIQREIEIQRHGSPTAAIERADHRATVVFAIGVMLASMLLLIILLVACVYVVALVISLATGNLANIGRIFIGCMLALLLCMFIANLLDRYRGDRLRKDGLARRLLAAVLGVYVRLGITQKSSSSTFSLLASHDGERRAVALTSTILFVSGAVVAFSILSQQDPRSLGNYELFPAFADGAHTLDNAHYADQRNPARDRAVPFINSSVVTAPYLRLVVPYRPQQDAIALRNTCVPTSTGEADQQAIAALACLQQLHAVSLDGKPLPLLQYELGSDDRTDRPALVAMIDMRPLTPGRHELQVARLPNPKADKDTPDRRGDPWRIPFWR